MTFSNVGLSFAGPKPLARALALVFLKVPREAFSAFFLALSCGVNLRFIKLEVGCLFELPLQILRVIMNATGHSV